jgi:hypothetical protein
MSNVLAIFVIFYVHEHDFHCNLFWGDYHNNNFTNIRTFFIIIEIMYRRITKKGNICHKGIHLSHIGF